MGSLLGIMKSPNCRVNRFHFVGQPFSIVHKVLTDVKEAFGIVLDPKDD